MIRLLTVLPVAGTALHCAMRSLWATLSAPTSDRITASINHVALQVAVMPCHAVVAAADHLGPVAHSVAWWLLGGP